MKKFSFPLARVLDWRQTQLRREEIKLEQLYAELRGLDAGLTLLQHELAAAEADLRAWPAVAARELTALHAYQEHAANERGRIAKARAGCQQRIAAQLKLLIQKRRDMKLLEMLKQQRLTAWTQENDREIAQQAEESHLAKWNRRNIQ